MAAYLNAFANSSVSLRDKKPSVSLNYFRNPVAVEAMERMSIRGFGAGGSLAVV